MYDRRPGRPFKEDKEPRSFKKPALYQVRLKDDNLTYLQILLADKYSAGKFFAELLEVLRFYHERKPSILIEVLGINFYNKYFRAAEKAISKKETK